VHAFIEEIKKSQQETTNTANQLNANNQLLNSIHFNKET